MLVKGPVVAVGSLIDWLRRRDERRAMLMAVDELNLSRDEMLSDIGITRDELVLASRFRGMGSIGGHSGGCSN
jgi:uncharacterized protein YjiS (DUF1127 family)